MSTLRVSTIQDTAGSNSSTPSAIANGICKAWVNFNGQGTIAIRASFNVSSITDNGASDYTINFTNALVDANYGYVFGKDTASSDGPNSTYNSVLTAATALNSSLRIRSVYSNGVIGNDPTGNCAAVFR